jgi:iron transport multicopper oxidase
VPLGTDLAAPGTAVAGGANKVWNLAITFSGGTFSINGVPFVNPDVPVLLQLLSGAQTPSSLLPSGSIYDISLGDVVELSIPGGTVGAPVCLSLYYFFLLLWAHEVVQHPFHLHGHTFYVVRSAGSTTYNYVNPVRSDFPFTSTIIDYTLCLQPQRDVVNTGTSTSDNVTIRFVADNPGPWFLHCHIDWHLNTGLAIVFAEDAADWSADIKPTSAWDQLCPNYSAAASTDKP